MKRARYFELAGMVLILASAGWQLFVDRPIAQIVEGGERYKDRVRLDAIFGLALDTYTHEFPERSKMTSIANPDAYVDLLRQVENTTQVEGQAKVTSIVTGCLFLLGSALAAFGKLLEIKTLPKA